VVGLYVVPLAQSPRLKASNWAMPEQVELTKKVSPPETLGGRGFLDSRKGSELREAPGWNRS
jgi:hypothetical protein